MQIPEIADTITSVISNVEKAVVGKRPLLIKMMAAFLVPGGHLLLEDYPGLAKTLIASSFAHTLGLQFKRIQFTPDLLPGDITGGYIYQREAGAQVDQFVLQEGPVFSQIVLADEVNRASPKTQSALLEAMQERQVTLEGKTFKLPEPFIVIATQNPIEYEGTFPLPEAQLDRFMMKLPIGYPSPSEEEEILNQRQLRQQDDVLLDQVTDAHQILEMRRAVEGVHVTADIVRYMVTLTRETRQHRSVVVGASPRGSLALLKLARAWAVIQGRDYVLPDDVKEFFEPALIHRIILEPELWMEPQAGREVLQNILRSVPVPVLDKDFM